MSEGIYSTALAKVNDTFAPMIERQLVGNGIRMDEYSKQCVLSALSSINQVLDSKAISWKDEQLDRNNLTQILLTVASLKLNAAASPREVYFQLRNVAVRTKNNGQEVTVWKKQIEMGIEGDGNDAILSRFGRNVKEVRQFWLVREHDEFVFPKFNGLDLEPPKWTPKGSGDVVRIVYPIVRDNDVIEYHIAERDDVVRNLLAHINNNLMNETFGICADKRKADTKQLKEINIKKTEILKRAKEIGLQSLDDAELQEYISPAWTDFHSRESMMIRKMRNNIVKKIPKDFGNGFAEMIYSETTDESYAATRREIIENANTEPIDITPEDDKKLDQDPEKVEDSIEQPPQPPKPQETVKNNASGPGF